MATADERRLIAGALWDARRDRATIAPPSARFAGFDLEDGYAVGAALYERRVHAGERRVGLKIGFTNTAVWETYGLREPICAAIYDGTVRYAGDARTEIAVDTTPFVAPAIEPEVVVGLVPDGVSWWALGFEIVHCHFPGWRMTPADALADSGLHGMLVVGGRIPLAPGSSALRTAFGIELHRNDALYERATSAAVLGGPLDVLERASAICARTGILAPPQPGEIVTTGSLTSAPRIEPGETWTVRADNDAPALRITVR
ncbi:MAG: 2-oxo-hepta-3-ene-1,7-dioic acid hydratase [Candidatus Elarobacter sp.]